MERKRKLMEASVWDQYVECAIMFLANHPERLIQNHPTMGPKDFSSQVAHFAVTLADSLLAKRGERFARSSADPEDPLTEDDVRWEKGWWLGEGFVCVGGGAGCVQSTNPTHKSVEIPFPQPMYFTGERNVILCAKCALAKGHGVPPKTPLERRPA